LFIHQNKRKIRASVRENTYHYNLAVYYYATSQYKKALQLLYQVDFTDIRCDLGESEAFSALVETFRIYVKRNK